MTHAYYSEWEPYPAQWLRNLAADEQIPMGEVDERSIADVRADDLRRFRQWHWFAGVGGWPIACRLAGWPDDREILTASFPCQPWSKAGRRGKTNDARDLWPDTLPLIAGLMPEVAVGEQVDGPDGNFWIDRARVDLEALGYGFGAIILPACGVNAPTRRYRWWWIASRTERGRKALGRIGAQGELQSSGLFSIKRGWNRDGSRRGSGLPAVEFDPAEGRRPAREPSEAFSEPGSEQRSSGRSCPDRGAVADCFRARPQERCIAEGHRGDLRNEREAEALAQRITKEWPAVGGLGQWSNYDWAIGPDRDKRTGRIKARRVPRFVERPVRGVVTGIPAGSPELRSILLTQGEAQRANKIKGYGNSIIPALGALVLRSFMDAEASC